MKQLLRTLWSPESGQTSEHTSQMTRDAQLVINTWTTFSVTLIVTQCDA